QFFLFFRREPNDIFLVHTDPFQKNDTLKVVSAIPIQPLKSNVMRYYLNSPLFRLHLSNLPKKLDPYDAHIGLLAADCSGTLAIHARPYRWVSPSPQNQLHRR
ncbi:MAG TPA: hypothetical protein VJJ98_08055, partial [Sedimentisphaerales bacterium]|nr:hypothetical protein [Sedimentisphaerales bacterium]